ncbi:dna-directed rna polymerases i ii and iii subunit rpabc2 [Holotrichia oblita]|uniref:Dna-directed rna polymerases i ii and iii subunit rpabc2 n=1 Tax=Holotrichia oblita TaxID=644536 RepID=A0ACB9SNY8_HOLOL|nr:dna-directed rna polymerases i ii and iii subunit rpabc2 [Holotrichia oblita]
MRGQNLNKYMAAMCLTAVQEIPHLKSIDLKFLVVGHSEMECDSMHSAISTESKRVGKTNWPQDYKTIARCARRKGDKPYLVHDITHNLILDWKSHADRNMIFRKIDQDRRQVGWQKISCMNFSKCRPFVMRFKESFDEDFRILNCNRKTRVRSSATYTLNPLYSCKIPIKKDKYDDLLSLFEGKPPPIPIEYKPYYENLPFQGDQRERNQETPQGYESDISDMSN